MVAVSARSNSSLAGRVPAPAVKGGGGHGSSRRRALGTSKCWGREDPQGVLVVVRSPVWIPYPLPVVGRVA